LVENVFLGNFLLEFLARTQDIHLFLSTKPPRSDFRPWEILSFDTPNPTSTNHAQQFSIMADVATPSGAAMFDGSASEKQKLTKPEKPDEEAYKASLQKADKEHKASMDKLVSCNCPYCMRCGRKFPPPSGIYIETYSNYSRRMLSKPN
jgi:hypothetical protein